VRTLSIWNHGAETMWVVLEPMGDLYSLQPHSKVQLKGTFDLQGTEELEIGLSDDRTISVYCPEETEVIIDDVKVGPPQPGPSGASG